MAAIGEPAAILKCSECGFEDPALGGLGPFYTFPTADFQQLRALFAGDLDEYRCPGGNHKRIGLRPTVRLALEDGRSMLSWGSIADRYEAAREAFIRDAGVEITTFASPDELRLAAAHYAADRLLDVIAAGDRLREGAPKDWRSFTSGYFACSALLISAPLPGVNIQLPEGVSIEDIFRVIVDLQVMVWLAWCGSWSGELEPCRTLEAEFGRYLVPNSVIHRAADEFVRVTDDLTNWPYLDRFCAEAVRATLCHVRGTANTHASAWAECLVEQEVSRRFAGQEVPPHTLAMEISGERIRATVPYEVLFRACVKVLHDAGTGTRSLEAINALGAKAGYPRLAAQLVLSLRLVVEGDNKVSVEQLVCALAASSKGKSREAIWLAARDFLDKLDVDITPATLTSIADGLLAALGDSPEERARADHWLSSQLLSHRFVKAALERVGPEPRSWEAELPPDLRSYLLNERSNALHLAGRPIEAIAAAESAMEILAENGLEPCPEARRNLGILYQESGRQQQALDIFFEQLKTADQNLRLRLLISIATTYSSLGRVADSVPYLEEALSLARGPLSAFRAEALTVLAMAKSATGRKKEALALLREVPSESCSDPAVLMPYASAWINTAQEPGLMGAADRNRLSEMRKLLHASFETSFEAGDMQVHITALRLLAILSDLVLVLKRKNVFWDLLDCASREFEGAPDPMALLALARDAWAEENLDRAKAALAELPDAVAARFGAEADPALKVESLHMLRRYFDQIGSLAIRGHSRDDVRIVAEAQRDLMGRMTLGRAGATPASAWVSPDATAVAHLGGPCAVLEWLDTTDGVVGLATFIGADGGVRTTDIGDIGVDLDALAAKMTYRLSNWHEDRAGDPFDLDAWKKFEALLHETLEGHLPDGGQLVVIEHPAVWGLQWHAAAAPRWRTSYAPSWAALLDQSVPPADRSGALGVAMTAKFGDSPLVTEALEHSVAQALLVAGCVGRHVELRLAERCDRAAIIELFASCGIVELLCHGYVDPEDRQVALSIAIDGELPLADSAASATTAGRRHRFGWQECQTLAGAPAVVLSAACSSGRAHPAGLGERLGFFRVLRRAGTRSFIAPRWDIKPAAVLRILDDVMTRQLQDGDSPGVSLYNACLEASKTQPRWIAWALALEGDWR